MILGNKEEFDFLNITEFHKQNIKGQNMKIGVIDTWFDISKSHLKDVVKPVGVYKKESSVPDYLKGNHGEMVCDIIHQIAPEAEIYLGSPSAATLAHHFSEKNAIDQIGRDVDGSVDVVTMSLSFPLGDPFGKTDDLDFINDEFYLFTSAGNEGVRGLTNPARNKENNWFSVGACYLDDNGDLQINLDDIKLNDYSSIGEELDVMSLDHLYVKTNGEYRKFYGTSCASPVLAAMSLLVLQVHNNKVWTPLFHDFLEIYGARNDIHTKGFDIKTGYGLFRLPKPEYITVHKD